MHRLSIPFNCLPFENSPLVSRITAVYMSLIAAICEFVHVEPVLSACVSGGAERRGVNMCVK